jgi:hypothetical protein
VPGWGPIAGIEARAIESSARRPNDRARRLRFSDVIVPMKRVWRRKRFGRCDQE